jgi:diaminohydroxyphosphoribosylaminopyrimidine deaminase/5-amino-6-(5-phosphoribosylamino)uracil reductase
VSDEVFMRRALELAARAVRTYPNPKVGAVVVRNGNVIGEGFHRGSGQPHAETEALRGIDAGGATLYVNLEPCNHQAGTPPCAPAVAAAGIKRVVVATEDPDERVSGRGIAFLREQGVKVDVGVLHDEARALNAPFLLHRSEGRSFLSLKIATSIDGRSAAPDGTSRWITGSKARRLVHERRRASDAVLVGAGTVLADDPALTVRDVSTERQPLRVVVDARGRIAPTARLFSEDGDVMVATTDASTHERHMGWKEAGAEVFVIPIF